MSSHEIHITAIGHKEAAHDLEGVAARAKAPLSEAIWDPLHDSEKRVFMRLRPKMRDSGKLERSLTERHAVGAVRTLHKSGKTARFGTRVKYARAAAHQVGSYILVIDRQAHEEMHRATMDYIIGKHGRRRTIRSFLR